MGNTNTGTLVAAFALPLALCSCELLGFEDAADGGYGDDCGLEECEHELVVDIIRPDGEAFAMGAYTFTLVAPDASEYFVECDFYDFDVGMECVVGDLDVMLAAIDAYAEEITLEIAGAPEYVLVVIEQDGYIIAERTLQPEYELVTPNGEDCPPACYVGSDAMAVMPW